MTSPAPVIAVGIDVAGPEQIERLCAAGALPTLEALRRRGAFARLQSVTELSSGLIWPTFATGVNPGKHGQFFTHMQLETGSYRIVKKYADDLVCDPFWLALHRAGRRVAIVDVPQTRPTEGLRGVQITGWGSEYPAWPRSSWPPELLPEVVRRFGSHPLVDRYRLSISPETEADTARLVDQLLDGARSKGALSRWLLERDPCDFFLTIFPETHWAMHLLWQLRDGERAPARFRNVFRDLFATIDAAIGELVTLRPDATFVVFSLSGMGPNASGSYLLPEVLERLGLARPAARGRRGWLPIRRWGASRVRGVEDTLSLRVIETAKRLTPTRVWDRAARGLLHAGSGWADSRAFCVPNDYSGAIRINLAGREPRGRVEPGAEYEALCDELTAELLALEDGETGARVVREVVRTRAVCHGPRLDDLPDLIVLWQNEQPPSAVRSPRIGAVKRPFPERRTGAHRATGFALAAGPGIREGVSVADLHTLDLAPTLLHLCGEPAPPELDGAVAAQLLDGEPAARAAPGR